MTQIFQSPGNFREIVVGQVQASKGRHGGYLRRNALQTVAGQIQNCHLRQKSKSAREALRKETLQERSEIVNKIIHLYLIMSQVEIVQHVNLADFVLNALYLIVVDLKDL